MLLSLPLLVADMNRVSPPRTGGAGWQRARGADSAGWPRTGSHRLAPGRLRYRLRTGHQAELVHQQQIVAARGMFDDLAALHAPDVDLVCFARLARRCHGAHDAAGSDPLLELAQVRAAH